MAASPFSNFSRLVPFSRIVGNRRRGFVSWLVAAMLERTDRRE
jgi:hypothetical protein